MKDDSVLLAHEIKMSSAFIPVFFHEGMLAHTDDQSKVTGGHENGAFGKWKTKGGAEIHVSMESPWPMKTLLHEWVHALFALRGHPEAYREDSNEMEWICDIVSDGVDELFDRNPWIPMQVQVAIQRGLDAKRDRDATSGGTDPTQGFFENVDKCEAERDPMRSMLHGIHKHDVLERIAKEKKRAIEGGDPAWVTVKRGDLEYMEGVVRGE